MRPKGKQRPKKTDKVEEKKTKRRSKTVYQEDDLIIQAKDYQVEPATDAELTIEAEDPVFGNEEPEETA